MTLQQFIDALNEKFSTTGYRFEAGTGDTGDILMDEQRTCGVFSNQPEWHLIEFMTLVDAFVTYDPFVGRNSQGVLYAETPCWSVLARKPHLYTLHVTYTGVWCVVCGECYDADWHDQTKWLVDGQIVAKGDTDDTGTDNR